MSTDGREGYRTLRVRLETLDTLHKIRDLFVEKGLSELPPNYVTTDQRKTHKKTISMSMVIDIAARVLRQQLEGQQ